MKNKKIYSFLLILLLLFAIVGCNKKKTLDQDIHIIYTSDVHCSVDNNLGYQAVGAFKKYAKTLSDYVTLVDCGDAIQGDMIGSVSQGSYIIDIMNYLEYDLCVLGNHEFDYGMDNIKSLIEKSNAEYIACNIKYTGNGTNKLSDVLPYSIKTYGDYKVGYVGVSTPHTTTSSTPAYFMENGEFAYSFCPSNFYETIQENVDECKKKGCDYVVLCSHLGDDIDYSYSSREVIQKTTGIDAILDAHAHNVIDNEVLKNKNGEDVILTSTGTGLNYVGELVIRKDGKIVSNLINLKDKDVQEYVDGIKSSYQDKLNEIVANTNETLYVEDSDHVRMIRNRETNCGDFVADAYKALTGADIAIVNGGGIRANLEAGEITYEEIISVHPFGNTICMVEATGQEILDALEMSCREVQSEYKKDGKAVGEQGGFLQVSGIKYTVDTSVETSVVMDENGMFVRVGGARRVKDVYVLEGNQYVSIDVNKTYKLASHNYIIKNGGNGINMFMNKSLLLDGILNDYDCIITYLCDYLNGDLSKYHNVDNRIIVE